MCDSCQRETAGARLTVADILTRFHKRYLEAYGERMSFEQRKALQSILLCRTPVMGGRSFLCSHCDAWHFAWHSCNNRLCPRCGSAATADWVADKLENRLPVEYYMVTFTLPAQLRGVCRRSAAIFLKRFFASSSQAIKDVLKEPRHIGGECGFIGFLQTWKQDLGLHPHIHYIVPAVGIDGKGKLKRPRRPGWLAKGEVFASRLKTLLIRSLQEEGLLTSGQASGLWAMTWNCDVKNFGDGSNAIKYLGGYLCKGPISDSRILYLRGEVIGISVKDRETSETRPVEINVLEFIHRYLQHALPSGFHAVRYFGVLHPRAKVKLAAIREQLDWKLEKKNGKEEQAAGGPVTMLCPRCRKPMEMVANIARAPPDERCIPEVWLRRDRRAA